MSIGAKLSTARRALAVAHVAFSKPDTLRLVRAHALRKGDVLAVARIAGVMAAKRTPDVVPLCHPGVAIEGVGVRVETVGPEGVGADSGGDGVDAAQESGAVEAGEEARRIVDARLQKELTTPLGSHGGVRLAVEVECSGKTGVEMEALTGVMGAALTVVDMCKGADREMVVGGMQVVRKEGGRSGRWIAGGWK